MKKYWKLFMLGIFTFSLLGIHYVQAARETSDYLTLGLKTIHGDESVVAERTFYGSYNQSNIYQSAIVKLNGARTALKGLYVYDIFSYIPIEMEPLTKQYRSFTRGKMVQPMFYYEDEQRLLYVDIPIKNNQTSPMPVTLHVSSLTKEDGKQVDYTATTLQSLPFEYVYVEDVQFVDGYIKVVANAFEAGRGSMLYVFTIDDKTRTVKEYKPLTTTEEGEKQVGNRLYKDYYSFTSQTKQTNFLYGSSSDYVEATPNSATSDENAKDFKLYKLDLKTMETALIDVPEAVRNNSSTSTATNDATYFVVYGENNTLELYSYHFDNDEWTHIELENSFDVAASQVFVVDDVLYVPHEKYGDVVKSFVDAYDVTTGKQLYRGEVTSKSDKPFNFNMSSMK